MADRAPPVSQVAEFKDGGGVEGATSGIYQTATGTLSAADGSKSYDKIMSDVRRPSLPLSASQTRADLASDQFKKDMDYTFDDCSKTPFLYSSSSQMLITCATSRSAATVVSADPRASRRRRPRLVRDQGRRGRQWPHGLQPLRCIDPEQRRHAERCGQEGVLDGGRASGRPQGLQTLETGRNVYLYRLRRSVVLR